MQDIFCIYNNTSFGLRYSVKLLYLLQARLMISSVVQEHDVVKLFSLKKHLWTCKVAWV